jgi:hypothetical protein
MMWARVPIGNSGRSAPGGGARVLEGISVETDAHDREADWHRGSRICDEFFPTWRGSARHRDSGALDPAAPTHQVPLLRSLFDDVGASLVTLAHGGFELDPQVFDRCTKLVAALARGLCESRIVEVADILDTGPIFLGLNLPLEVDRHRLEVSDHLLETQHFTRFLLSLETLRAERGFP